MKELNIGLPSCYQAVYKSHESDNLIITFTPTNGFFLYNNDLNAHKICISTNQPNYYIFNPGNACNKLSKYIEKLDVKKILLIGSSKAGLASILWGELIKRNINKSTKIFVLSFSPQTLLYPFNKRLYFPSYKAFINLISKSDSIKKCAENYGDLNNVLEESKLKGIVIYPKDNYCDRLEATRIKAKGIILYGLQYPLHGSFLPFMSQTRDSKQLSKMVNKIYQNSLKDMDLNATIPKSADELLNIISSINVPTIEQLCKNIFYKLDLGEDISVETIFIKN